MLLPTLERNVLGEMREILQPLEGVIDGSRMLYVLFDQRMARPNNSKMMMMSENMDSRL
jgi:hypothetical protein